MAKPWPRLDRQILQRCVIFDLHQVRFELPNGEPSRHFYVVEAPDWINVIALTPDDQVLLVRQFRFGIESHTLEIPGGMSDPGETPLESARRELREETGYEAKQWTELGWVHPNPPIQNNRCYTFLARGAVRVGEPSPDESEHFELEKVPLAEIPRLFRENAITHALVLSAFQLFRIHETEGADAP